MNKPEDKKVKKSRKSSFDKGNVFQAPSMDLPYGARMNLLGKMSTLEFKSLPLAERKRVYAEWVLDEMIREDIENLIK